MITTRIPDPLHAILLNPAVKQALPGRWQEELDFLEKEVDFYCQLLKMGIRNGSDDKKQQLFKLLEAFSKFRETQLPEMRSLVNAEGLAPEAKRETAAAVSEKFERCNSHLKKLKSGVFPHIFQLQNFTIW